MLGSAKGKQQELVRHLRPETGMQWRKWRTTARLWRIEVDAKSGPLETGDFGKNRQRAGDNDAKRPGPLETGDQEQCIDHIPY